MNSKVLNLTYASSLTGLCEVNSSFDSGILRIAYPGQNRNATFISKETFERCAKTIFNCPLVCNYDRESDTIGGHDVEVVRNQEGGMELVNLTTPVGCVPESARVFWEDVTEEDGTTREYLCAEVLLWKRQEAYKKIKEDGITAHSMEIAVKDGEFIDGVYYIYNFEFTAFALIGVEPCFESSALTTFSKKNFKEQFSEMMHDLHKSFNLVKSSNNNGDSKSFNLVESSNNEGDNKILTNNSTKGGEHGLDKNELIAKYGIDVNALDFSIDDYSVEELEAKFQAMAKAKPGDNASDDKFALMSNVLDEVCRSLESVKIQREWGEAGRYQYVDIDPETKEVFCWDTEDWLLYGFTYNLNEGNVAVNFDSKKRKKYTIVDVDEGEQASPFADVFADIEQRIKDSTARTAEYEAKYQTASEQIASMEKELTELRKLKSDIETAAAQNERDEIFAQFADLAGVEEFEALKDNCAEYDVDALEEKCYAIRGRHMATAKFALDTAAKTPKLKVEKEHIDNAPYGGIFEKYGFSTRD